MAAHSRGHVRHQGGGEPGLVAVEDGVDPGSSMFMKFMELDKGIRVDCIFGMLS